MRRRLRHAGRFAGDLVAYSYRTGRWWVPVVTIALAIAVVFVVVVKVAAPTAVYVFF